MGERNLFAHTRGVCFIDLTSMGPDLQFNADSEQLLLLSKDTIRCFAVTCEERVTV